MTSENQAYIEKVSTILRKFNTREHCEDTIQKYAESINFRMFIAIHNTHRKPTHDAKKESSIPNEREQLQNLKKSLDKTFTALNSVHPNLHAKLDFSFLADNWNGYSVQIDEKNNREIRLNSAIQKHPQTLKDKLNYLLIVYEEAVDRLLENKTESLTKKRTGRKKDYLNDLKFVNRAEITQVTAKLKSIYEALSGKIGGRGRLAAYEAGGANPHTEFVQFVDEIYRAYPDIPSKVSADSQIKTLIQREGVKKKGRKNMERESK